MVFKKITLIGRSTENFEGAVENAVTRAEETIENLMWVSVVAQTVEVEEMNANTRLKLKSHSNAASLSSGNASNTPSREQHRSTKPARSAPATRDNCRRERGCPAAALAIRPITLGRRSCRKTHACRGLRDMLRVIRAEHESKAEDLKPALDETEILSEKIDELWHDEWRGYAPLVYENEQTVVHTEEYVAEDGVHTNQVGCLWSLIEPWLEKFRGLSKPGLEQSSEPTGLYGR